MADHPVERLGGDVYKRQAQTLQQILITVVIYEAGFKLIYHSRLVTSCFHFIEMCIRDR